MKMWSSTSVPLILGAKMVSAISGVLSWITPPAVKRRYDTVFFVALVPEGQEADAHTTEAVEATWWYPAEALEHWQRGEIELMAPTLRTLQEIAEHPDSAAVLAAADERVVRPVTPEVRREGGKVVVVLPDDPDFQLDVERIVPGGSA